MFDFTFFISGASNFMSHVIQEMHKWRVTWNWGTTLITFRLIFSHQCRLKLELINTIDYLDGLGNDCKLSD